jgi:hypothetical protein
MTRSPSRTGSEERRWAWCPTRWKLVGMHRSEGEPGIWCLQPRAERRPAGPQTAGPRGGGRTPAERAGGPGQGGARRAPEAPGTRGRAPRRVAPPTERRVQRHPPSDECSAVGAGGVEGTKGWRRRPHSHVGGAGRRQEGGVGLEGGGKAQAKPAGAQGKGELRDHGVRLHLSRRRVLHQAEGGKKHLTFGGSDVGGKLRPRGDAGQVGQARL